MSEYKSILIKYWGYSHFRPLQEDIIRSVAEGKDSLGLLPTGGGKSIIFQVYALSRDGVCLVITPLIALMKDQVGNLKKRNIKAAAIYSGMTSKEIDVTFTNVVNGRYKFLYISPERLQTTFFKNKLHLLNVNLLAIDEAHCISQWGHDFRPSYREIIKVRENLQNVPVLALTATATKSVVKDIQEQLGFEKENVFSKSFERKNLTYTVRNIENKTKELFKIITNTSGSGIVYVRNRKGTKELALMLKQYNISADYYHAGLDAEVRNFKQDQWQKGAIRIMVCTNAFGMGIDKPDVRFVIHWTLPESPEEYFQEAGRAGRDGNDAIAILLYNNADKVKAKQRLTKSFPEISKIKDIYQSLANNFQIAVEEGLHKSYEFNIFDFAKKFKYDITTTYNALKVLQSEGFIEYNETVYSQSRVYFVPNRDELYKFQVANRKIDPFIKLLLRNYSGIFTDYVNISEENLAKKTFTTTNVIIDYLKILRKAGQIDYIPRKTKPSIVYLLERCNIKDLHIDKKKYEEKYIRQKDRVEAMLYYANTQTKCRSVILLNYFGQKNVNRCGNCDVCKTRNKLSLSTYEFDIILKELKDLITDKELLLNEIVDETKYEEADVVRVIQWLFENDKVRYSTENRIIWNR